MVALSVAFYARLSVGSRQIVEIFNILNEFMGNVFGKVPAYTTIETSAKLSLPLINSLITTLNLK